MTCHNCMNQKGYCGEPFSCELSKGNPDTDYIECGAYDPWSEENSSEDESFVTL